MAGLPLANRGMPLRAYVPSLKYSNFLFRGNDLYLSYLKAFGLYPHSLELQKYAEP